MPEYLVVSRAQSGVRLGKDDPLLLRNYPTDVGPCDILIKTRLVPSKGFSKPLPMGLMAETRGMAPSIDAALQNFSKAAQSLCQTLAFLGNSPVEDMAPEIGYDVSPGITEREFFQSFMPEEKLLHVARRRLSSELIVRFLQTLHNHGEVERITRAIGQYYQALRNWEPGQGILALAHLWMGGEALTPVVLRRVLKSGGLDQAVLASEWKVQERQLDSEVRKRLVMHGDEVAYSRAKAASDGLEHGFLGFDVVHSHAESVRHCVAEHLRRSIIDELNLDAADSALILAAPYDTPGHLGGAKYLRGKLIGTGETLAAPGQAHPIFFWTTSTVETPNTSPDEVSFDVIENLTGHFADGIRFLRDRIEIWGGQESAMKNKGAEPRREEDLPLAND